MRMRASLLIVGKSESCSKKFDLAWPEGSETPDRGTEVNFVYLWEKRFDVNRFKIAGTLNGLSGERHAGITHKRIARMFVMTGAVSDIVRLNGAEFFCRSDSRCRRT